MKAARCSLCGGEPEFVYYAIPVCENSRGWMWDGDGFHPLILLKQIRCKKCGAVCATYDLSCDDAVEHWNEQHLLQLIGTEHCEIGVEPDRE